MTHVQVPYTPVPGGPEDVTEVNADFAAIAAVINGNLTDDNIAANAAIEYLKLALAGRIVDNDISALAAIAVAKLAAGTNGALLKTAGGVPQWAKGSNGALLYQGSADVLYTGAPVEGQSLRAVAGVPTWVDVPACRVFRAALQSIPDATETTINFTDERYDTDAMHDTTTNQGRLVAKTPGIYAMIAMASFDQDPDGRREVKIRHTAAAGGTQTDIAHVMLDNLVGTNVQRMQAASHWPMLANDYVEMRVFHNAGNSLDVTVAAGRSPEFMMARIA